MSEQPDAKAALLDLWKKYNWVSQKLETTKEGDRTFPRLINSYTKLLKLIKEYIRLTDSGRISEKDLVSLFERIGQDKNVLITIRREE